VFKNGMLSKANILKSNKQINENPQGGKVLIKNANLNSLAYTELILLINESNSSGKFVFSIIKGVSKGSKDYTVGNSALD
jgi:hypothetical protein